MYDPINHPSHYTAHPSGVEAIEITECLSFNLGNALKYAWRCGHKSAAKDDLLKAAWYLRREANRLESDSYESMNDLRYQKLNTVIAHESPRTPLGMIARMLKGWGTGDREEMVNIAGQLESMAVLL